MQHNLAGSDEPGLSTMTEALSVWLVSYSRSDEYLALVERFIALDHITPAFETALIYAIIQRLQPQVTVEIGTFFAATTRIMAQAIVEGQVPGKLITLDPFGEHRVPGILAAWPEEMRAVTDFRPWNSMQYFLELETLGIPKGAGSPLGVVFVDGHHNFEYALYDIIRSADHLSPDGAIIVDNLEQEGPKTAVIQFLRWNPAWSIFYRGGVFTKGNVSRATFTVENEREVCWGVLLPPAGLQVSANTIKLMKRGIAYVAADELHLNLQHLSHPGTLNVSFTYFSIPYDFHITGEGMCSHHHKTRIPVPALASPLKVRFPATMALAIAPEGSNVCYEAELAFEGDASDNAYILLDAAQPFSLWSA